MGLIEIVSLIEIWLWQSCSYVAYGWTILEVTLEDTSPIVQSIPSILHNYQTTSLLGID